MRGTGAEQPVVAKKFVKADRAKGLRHPARNGSQPQGREELSVQAKSFSISKMAVWEAYCDVKANKGAAGVDSKSLDDFEQDLKSNLYKLWNRMSSGTYFPKPVRRVEIPKAGGGMRQLGIPTVEDRIAQAVAKKYLEPLVEPHFHRDSYGYRPGKSALDAVEVTRRRCWRYDWVIDLDIRGFFDNLDHELVLRAVRRFTSEKWMLLYIDRWLKVPVQKENGELDTREKGTPQGGVISPLLANIFMHLAFDDWMKTSHPRTPFARYADDVIVHCRTLEEAQCLLASIKSRLARCLLELHPGKTRIVYCKDGKRPNHHVDEAFDFSGLHLSTETGVEQVWPHIHRIHARRQQKSREGHVSENACLAPGALDGQGAVRYRRCTQSRDTRLDSLLRPVLPVCVEKGVSPFRPLPGQVGNAEIQEIQQA